MNRSFGDNYGCRDQAVIGSTRLQSCEVHSRLSRNKVNCAYKNNTVWLNRKQLAELFGRDVKTIGKHINNALKEELDNSVVANFATTASDGKVYQVEHYNLAIRFSILYRLNIEYTRFPIFPTPSVLF